MISGGNIKNILIKDVKNNPVFGSIAEIVKDNHAPVENGSVGERIVVVLPGSVDNGQFSRSFPRICIYVPYVSFVKPDKTKYYRPDNARLTEIEEECVKVFRSGVYGEHGDEVYVYKLEDITQEDDPDTWSNFINVKIRFEVVNTKL